MLDDTQFITRAGRRIEKVDDFRYRIEKNAPEGMRVPVTIHANEHLMSAMVVDRTLDQAVNVATLPGVQKHVVVLPDGHEGYGFPVGGVAATDLEEGVISPGGVGSLLSASREKHGSYLCLHGVRWSIGRSNAHEDPPA